MVNFSKYDENLNFNIFVLKENKDLKKMFTENRINEFKLIIIAGLHFWIKINLIKRFFLCRGFYKQNFVQTLFLKLKESKKNG